jgi:hypothetical protein
MRTGGIAMLGLILLIAAFVLALIEAFQPWQRPWGRPHLGWLAIALWLLVQILATGGLR